ncbi:Glycoside hydrolase family 31, partial [Dillenia turbinata]
QAFVSAALVETEVEESRGSFVIKDKDVLLVCNHQSIESIREVNSEIDDLIPEMEFKDTHFPVLAVTGWIFRGIEKKIKGYGGPPEKSQTEESGRWICARYSICFHQKSEDQVGFSVKLGKPNYERNLSSTIVLPADLKIFWSVKPKRFAKVGSFGERVEKKNWGLRTRGFARVASEDEEQRKLEFAEFNRVCLTYSSESNESFYGFGEQFSHMDFKGKRVPIFVQEQGIGRGDQPITLAVNLISYRASGDWSTTYAPSPFYMTSKLRSLYLEGYDYSVFDLTRHDRVQIQVYSNTVQGRILYGNSPAKLIESFTEGIGRPPELPEWIISGAVVGIQGGTDTVREVWDKLQTYDVPVSAFWLQDWVGQRETVIGSQLWWNWEVDTTRYKGWQQLVEDLNTEHIRVMTYCNPCLAPTDEKLNRRRNLFEEAKKLDILVKDKNGHPYMVPNTAFDVGMLDLTHPDTACWFKKILQQMVDDGVRGWMADFGEGLPVDACLYSGEDPISAHNRYPELWAQINREFVEEWQRERSDDQKEDSGDTMVFFMRSGFRDSPKWAMLFWEGDQMVSWQANDGIKSSVVGLLSSGLSGYAFNHSDIGGYCAVSLPLLKYHRSEELLLRWMELNAFTTVFRTHEGNKPSCNTQFYSNHQTFSHFARFSKVYKAWKFYRVQLVKEAATKGLPVCRHLFLHYPDDDHVHSLTYQQFLVGTEILVVPVLDKGKRNVKAYFPLGESSWQHIWTGNVYTKGGSEAWIDAPIGYPAIFVKVGSTVADTFLRNLKKFDVL